MGVARERQRATVQTPAERRAVAEWLALDSGFAGLEELRAALRRLLRALAETEGTE